MAGARGPTVTLHTPSSAFFRSWAPWTKSPETFTSAASGARRRKVTVRSVATSQELYAGGALPRPPRPAGAAGTCAGRRGVSIKGMANKDSLDMHRIVSIGAAPGHLSHFSLRAAQTFVGQIVNLRAGCLPALRAGWQPAAGCQPAASLPHTGCGSDALCPLPRVGQHGQLSRVGVAFDGQLHGVHAGRHPLALCAGSVPVDGGDRVLAAAAACAGNGRGVEIPDETVHTDAGSRPREGANPVGGHVDQRVGRRWLVGTLETGYHFASGIEDVDRHRA